MMVIDNKFNIGDMIYLKTDTDQRIRIITGILLKHMGMLYEISLAENVSNHYDYELSLEKNICLV